MRFTVVYTRLAESQLAALWLKATDRKSVEEAVNRIDRELTENADTKGQDFGGRYRLLSIAPLQALFEVRSSDRVVEVVALKKR